MFDKNFKKHIDNLVRKVQYKVHALPRIRKYLTIENVKILGKAFIDSRFNYSPLIWCSVGKHCILKLKNLIMGH